jgi:DNA repair exonuclease SbcCD ATPase subunit
MKNVTLDMCRQYIEQHKQKVVLSAQPGTSIASVSELRDKIFIVEIGKTDHTLILPSAGRYRELCFRKGRFYKESKTRHLENYALDRYRVSCFSLSLTAFSEWLEEQVLEEEISLSKKDAKLLQQHQIDVPPSRKTTRRNLQDAYQNLFKKDGAKANIAAHPVTPIIEKYCPVKQGETQVLELELEEVLKADEIVEIPKEHSEVFTKYGIPLPQKIGHKDYKESVHKTHIHPDVLKTISEQDLAVLRKYGIHISASGQAYGKVKAPRTLAAKIRLACAVTCVFSALGAGIWYFFGEDIKPWIQSEKIRLEANRYLNTVKQHAEELAQEAGEAARLLEMMAKEYPPEQDYVESHPRLLPIIKTCETRIQYWRDIVGKGEKLLSEKKTAEARTFLQSQSFYIANHPEGKQTIARVRSKLQITQRINQHLKDETEREVRVQRVVSTLRQYVLSAGEWLDLSDEKLAIIATRYARDKERIPVDAKIYSELAQTRKQLDELENACRVIEAAARTDYAKAEVLTKPYSDFQLAQVNKLRDLDESLAETLRALEKLANKGVGRNMANQKLAELGDRQSALRKLLDTADVASKQLEKFPADLGLPKLSKEMNDIIARADEESKHLRSLLTKAAQLIDDNRFNDAHAALSPEISSGKTVLPELRRVSETLAELCQRGQMLQMEKSERMLQVSKWLADMQRGSSEMKELLFGLDEEVKLQRDEYANNKDVASRFAQYQESVRQLSDLQNNATSLIAGVETKLQQKQLTEAQQMAQQGKATLDTLRSSLSKAKAVRSEITTLAREAKQQKERQDKLDSTQRILGKIEKYTTRLQEILEPMQKNSLRLAKNYPSSEGYPALSEVSQATLAKAQKSLGTYTALAKQARELLQKNQSDRAASLLQPYEARSLSEPNFTNDLKNLQNELSQKLQLAESIKKGKSKEGQAEQLIAEIRKRRDGLNTVIAALDKNLQLLQSQYGSLQDTQTNYAREYLRQGQEEVRSLDDLIGTAERLTKEHKYNAATDLVKPFVEAASHSLLPALNSFVANTEKTLQTFADPKLRAQVVAKAQAEQERKARQARLVRAPGSWYVELESVLNNYDRIKPQLEGAVKDGIRIVLTTIDSETSKAREYPRDIAEVDDIIAVLQQKGQKITSDPNSLRARDLNTYLETRSLNVDLREELSELKDSVSKLDTELRLGSWVEEETLRTFLRNIKGVDRKYREIYLNVKGPLETLETQLPN